MIESRPPANQASMNISSSLEFAATIDGVRNTPAPMTIPTHSAIAWREPSVGRGIEPVEP